MVSIMATFNFIVFFLSSQLFMSVSITVSHRRFLHHPFFPIDSYPPTSQPPSPPPIHQPFFPFYYSPPQPEPPPSTSLSDSVPANVSSMILPESSHSKRISGKLVAVVVSVSVFSVALVSIVAALLMYYRKRSGFDGQRRLPPNAAIFSDGTRKPPAPPKRNVLNTSSEFLYLGTIRGLDEDDQKASVSSNAVPGYHKLDSPELRPLPPLPRDTQPRNYDRALGSVVIEEEFFSPRGSSAGGNESPIMTESSNRRNRSYPSSNSISPSESMSNSPRSLRSKSNDSIIVNFPAPSRRPPFPPESSDGTVQRVDSMDQIRANIKKQTLLPQVDHETPVLDPKITMDDVYHQALSVSEGNIHISFLTNLSISSKGSPDMMDSELIKSLLKLVDVKSAEGFPPIDSGQSLQASGQEFE